MKRISIITGAILVAGLLAFPMAALAKDGRKHMDKTWQASRTYDSSSLTAEQRQQIDALQLKFRTDNAETMKSIMTKRFDLRTIFNSSEPDLAKAKTLQAEINDLEAGLDQKKLELFAEIHKINPNATLPHRRH